MPRVVFRRQELFEAKLCLGSSEIPLADYATTGLRIVAVGPSGIGKTNAGLLIAEQLAAQGWICVMVDPEGEIEALYGAAVSSPAALRSALVSRDERFLVVSARDAAEFLPYGQQIFEVADDVRRPVFLMIDEGQVFSTSRKRKKELGAASDLLNDFALRGRKRALDLFITATRFSGSLNRAVFGSKNLTLIGCQEDFSAWSALSAQFRGTGIGYNELASLAPGEFFCRSRRGVEKVVMPMAKALAAVAPKARRTRAALPGSFSQWDRAMREISTERLRALTPSIVALLSSVAGLSNQQLASGGRALQDELEARP